MFKFVNKLIGTTSSRRLKLYSKIVVVINNFEPSLKLLSDNDLANKTNELYAKSSV